MALPALVLVTLAAIWGVSLASVQLACTDAARSGARAAARGESLEAVRAVVTRALPPGAVVEVSRDAEQVRVAVTVDARAPVSTGLGSLTIRAQATAATEPGASEPGTFEPGTSEPGAVTPGASEPGAPEPGATASGAFEPGRV